MTDQTPSTHQESSLQTTITSTSPPDQSLDEDQRQKEALAAFTATLHSVGTNLEAPLRERATIINSNALSLERQEAELAGQSAKLAKQNEGWERMADETRAELKEIGDVQNWAEVIERDLLVLESMMDEVEGVGSDDDSLDGRMSVDGEESGPRDHGDRDANGDVEMNGNGVENGNGNGAVDANKDEGKKKRWSWFSWW